MRGDGAPIFAIRDLEVRFKTLDGIVEAVRGVNVDVRAGETVAIVGESGSGKSQLMMARPRARSTIVATTFCDCRSGPSTRCVAGGSP